MIKWNYNNVDVEIKMGNVEFAEKYNDAFNKMEDFEKKLLSETDDIKKMKGYCQMFYELYDGIFGEGTSDKLFNREYDVELCNKVYESFLEAVEKDTMNINRSIDNLTKRKRRKAQR